MWQLPLSVPLVWILPWYLVSANQFAAHFDLFFEISLSTPAIRSVVWDHRWYVVPVVKMTTTKMIVIQKPIRIVFYAKDQTMAFRYQSSSIKTFWTFSQDVGFKSRNSFCIRPMRCHAWTISSAFQWAKMSKCWSNHKWWPHPISYGISIQSEDNVSMKMNASYATSKRTHKITAIWSVRQISPIGVVAAWNFGCHVSISVFQLQESKRKKMFKFRFLDLICRWWRAEYLRCWSHALLSWCWRGAIETYHNGTMQLFAGLHIHRLQCGSFRTWIWWIQSNQWRHELSKVTNWALLSTVESNYSIQFN